MSTLKFLLGYYNYIQHMKNKIVAIEALTLDGVMQAPGRPDEDTRDGFEYGGWAKTGDDPEMRNVIGKYMTAGWSLLVGRITYEDLYESWKVRHPSDPMAQALSNVQKFVVCHDPDYHLPWEHSTLLAGDAVNMIARLKKEHNKTLIIFGSGVLVRSLMQYELIDEYVLQIHPLVLGKGYGLFKGAGQASRLRLTDTVTTSTGVIIATYQVP
ncbi:MAG TPA: dihydrofolate reductase family protein, partial [Niabella sp.]